MAALAVTVFALIAAVEPAEAAFPGIKIVFDSFLPGQADSEIVTLGYNPNGGPVPEDPDPPLTDNTALDSGAAWSPSGSKITFERNSEIWVMNADVTKETRLTNNAVIDSNPTWSPNGLRIAFQSNRNTAAFPNAGGDQEIYTIKARPETSSTGDNEPRRLTDNTARDEASAWSPEGFHIAFMSNRRDNNLEIWVMSTLSDDNAVRLTNNRGIDEYPDWQRKRVR